MAPDMFKDAMTSVIFAIIGLLVIVGALAIAAGWILRGVFG